jgi:catechol 2,3-dioxygenase-like lactoylglutathione lyase family enzyme
MISSFLHVKLDVLDLDRSLDFYCGQLRMRQIVRYDRTDGVTIVQISPTGQPPGIELWHEPPHGPLNTDRIHVAFEVQGLRETVEELRGRGVKIDTEPFAIGHENIAFIRDPDNYLIELNEFSS